MTSTRIAAAPHRSALLGPAVVGVAAIGSVALLRIRDPNVAGAYPVCPSLNLFGLHCPRCGGLRGMHALTEGDVVGMVSSNLLLPVLLVLGVWGWVAWTSASVAGRPVVPLPRARPATTGVAIAVLVVYTILRNLTGTPFEVLAP